MKTQRRLSVLKTCKLFINGAFPRSESDRAIEVRSSAGEVIAHVAYGSRKDLRDAVEAAVAAQPKWAAMSAYNRGQILYRMAEMLEGKREEFVQALMQMSKGQSAKTSRSRKLKSQRRNVDASLDQEVEASIDRLVCFAGWADKYAQVLGCSNPVSGPYYNFTVPEPTGVVGALSPPNAPALLGLISLIAPPLCAGNSIVAIADGPSMIPAAILGEVCATSDVPAGVVNIITAPHSELLEPLAQHGNIGAISAANLSRAQSSILKAGAAVNLKRVHVAQIAEEDWLSPEVCESPRTIEPFVEMKTIWHPSAA